MKLFDRYQRILIMFVLLMVVATGCYRDAGKDIPEPTPHGNRSNQVVVNTNPSPTRTPTDTPRPTKMVATFTPSPTGQATETPVVGGPNLGEETTAEVEEEVEPTATFTAVADEEDANEDEVISPPGPADTGISPTPTATDTSEPVPGLATPTALADQDECIYLVQGGDTLSSIAREYDLLPEDFYPVNPELAADPNNLYIGQEIRIPGCESETTEDDDPPSGQPTDAPPADSAPPGTIIHVVQTGENLFRIATRYGVTVADLVAANDSLASENTIIYPGDRLIIPSQ